jgi:hypothetical protein
MRPRLGLQTGLDRVYCARWELRIRVLQALVRERRRQRWLPTSAQMKIGAPLENDEIFQEEGTKQPPIDDRDAPFNIIDIVNNRDDAHNHTKTYLTPDATDSG